MIALRSAAAILACGVLLALGVEAAQAQERIRVSGWVQWISGTKMQVNTGAGTVPIDLQQADQGSYQGLTAGDRVVVDGVVARDRNRVIAQDIWRMGSGSDYQAP